ncbi:acetyl-CoA synthase subunit gamma [Geomonas sp. RF6]|nr:acetyl-CoA synthase subunit gamma [Geomonas sp. RF6]
METAAGRVPRISSTLAFTDRVGSWKARWGINRMNFIVPPGLYAVGTPTAEAPVVVTANYKMSYDLVRQALSGRDIWLLVLETFGVNVWCAAGKGTFGTEELLYRMRETRLPEVVSHRRLLLPILGAPGVAGHEVTKKSGFTVTYAAIRAEDLPAFLDRGMVTTDEMRHLTFTLYERMVLVPVELVLVMKSLLVTGIAIFLLFAVASGLGAGLAALIAYAGAVITGTALTPLLLPALPTRSFLVKGAVAGVLWSWLFYAVAGGSSLGPAATAALFLGVPAVSAFYALNFTGCTNYTSLSGVNREMRMGMPVMGCAIVASTVLLLVSRFG